MLALHKRKVATLFRWVKGHDRHEGNGMADCLAGEGAQKTEADNINILLLSEGNCKIEESVCKQ